MGGAIRRMGDAAARMRDDARGNVAMMMALCAPVVVMMTLGGVDIHRAATVRVNLQDALDAAALAAARSPYTAAADIQRVGMAALKANLKAYPSITLREADTTFVLNADDVVVARSKVNVQAIVANIVLPPYGKFMDDYLPVGATSEVDRSSRDVEVALVLDVTGSMAGQRIADLKNAANQLVNIVVQDVQTPFYSRMAIVPYSVGVNLGSNANAARGTAPAARPISGAVWANGDAKAITSISNASPGVVRASSHGFQTGDIVWIWDAAGMSQINDRRYRVVRLGSNTFSLESWTGSSWQAVSTSGYSNYSSGGFVRKCLLSDCSVRVTSTNHGLASGDGVYITGVGGMTGINNNPYLITRLDADNYSIGVNGARWGDYTSGGSSWCGYDGCQYRVYTSRWGTLRGRQITNCVSERAGTNAYTDAAPSTSRVGRNYSAPNNDCPASTVVPLKSDKTSLRSTIDNLQVAGSTAAQIGVGWGWYMVSPNFNSLWSGNPAAAYDPTRTLKVVIIMTDGEFNTPYATGVIAQDAGTGAGDTNYQINQNATNGSPFAQAEAMCAAMKARDVVVYTVGFTIAADGEAATTLARCATSTDHFFRPESGADLTEAFKAIGRHISQLRISK